MDGMQLPGFWAQAGLLAVALILIHLRNGGQWQSPLSSHWLREVAASVLVCVALFALVSGGRGCAPSSSAIESEHDLTDSPDPFGRR